MCSVDQECKRDCEEEGQTGMLLNRLWADWQKYLYCYLSGTVLVTIESQCYSAETHCEQGRSTRGIVKFTLSFCNYAVN